VKRAVLLIALAACGGKKAASSTPPPTTAPDAGPAPQPEIPEALRAKAEAAVALVEALAAAAEGAKVQTEAECPGLATALRAVADGPQGGAILAIDSDPDFPKYGVAISDVYGAGLEKASDRLGDAIMVCAYDPDVVQVLLDTGLIQSPAEGDEPVD
jgi:hypothetical protein